MGMDWQVKQLEFKPVSTKRFFMHLAILLFEKLFLRTIETEKGQMGFNTLLISRIGRRKHFILF